MQTIDSHTHFWDPARLDYSWLKNEPQLDRPFLADHVPSRVGTNEITGIVFVEAACAAEQTLAETDFVAALAAHDPRIRAIVAFAPLERGDAARPALQELKRRPLVRGVRRMFQDEPLGFALAPGFIQGVQLLAEYNFSFDICIRHWHLGDAIQLVRACPDVRFVLDHCGKPDIKHHLLEPWRTQISELAEFPNVWVKISGLVTEADHARWGPEDLRPYIEHVLTAFGIDRVMFGSDAPVAYLASAYERWVETLAAITSDLTEAERAKLWHDNAASFYRL